MYKISMLIPCTSHNRDAWTKMTDTYLYTLTLKHFVQTYDKEYAYTFYIGYDDGDRIFSDESQLDVLRQLNIPHVTFKFICFNNIDKGHVTKMWNVLFKQAYDDGNDYFYQCGDDIVFKTAGWVKDCVTMLLKTRGFGLVGPINNNNAILTQAFVSRQHMLIFGWFFPEEIINWCCDDWYNYVYKPQLFFPLHNHYCANAGGNPRYTVANNPSFKNKLAENTYNLRAKTFLLAQTHRLILTKYIQSNR